MSLGGPEAVATPEAGSGPTPVLYHLHIPKTAGTSLYAALAAHFPPEKVCPVQPPEGIARIPPEQLAAFDLIGGHLPFGYYLPEMLGRPVRPVTLLREPRAILLSIYKHVMQSPRDRLRQHVEENCPTIEAFFFDPVVSKYVADTQTRFLGASERRITPEFVARIRTADPAEIPSIFREADDARRVPDAAEMLRLASERLRECAIVGLVERMDESLARICARFGWPPPAAAPRRNVSQVRVGEQLPPHVLARLDQLSALDRLLYTESVRRFDGVG